MNIDIAKFTALSAAIGAIWLKLKSVYKELSPLIENFIQEAEEKAKDGIINKKDRKDLAMSLIAEAQKLGKLRKFNLLERLIVGKAVDWVAQRLPDFKFNKAPENG
jgi:hypothetical protein